MPMYESKCEKCGGVVEYFSFSTEEKVLECSCGGKLERIYSVPTVKVFQEYTTTNIRKDGKPVTVTSESHERELCRQHGVIKADSSIHGA